MEVENTRRVVLLNAEAQVLCDRRDVVDGGVQRIGRGHARAIGDADGDDIGAAVIDMAADDLVASDRACLARAVASRRGYLYL